VRQQPNVGLIPIIPLSSIRGCPMERGRWILFYFILSTSKISENGWKSCRWMKQHVNPALNEWKLIALYMYRWNTQEKKRRKREVTGGGPIWISKNLWTARYVFCNWPEELEYKSRRECTEIISVIRLLWLVTGRNLLLDKVGKNKKKLEKIEYYNPPSSVPMAKWHVGKCSPGTGSELGKVLWLKSKSENFRHLDFVSFFIIWISSVDLVFLSLLFSPPPCCWRSSSPLLRAAKNSHFVPL
jgi:hypothetical protein